MTMLSEVRGFAQVVADAIAAVIGVEVAMVDEKLATVAGSGRYSRHVGRVLKPDSVSARVLAEGRTVVVRNPPDDEVCAGCSQKSTCTDAADIISPLVIDDRPAGCVLLVACNQEQRGILLGAVDRWVNFLEKMTELIARAFNEKRKADEITALAQRFDTVINSVGEGILTLDAEGRILHANEAAARLIGMPAADMVSRHVRSVFPQFDMELLGAAGPDEPAEFETFSIGGTRRGGDGGGEKSYWLGTVSPVAGGALRGGYVVTFRGIDEIPRMVASYMRSERRFTFDDIMGSSRAIVRAKEIAKSIAASDSTVLILGESGTGKELFARAIHSESPRRRGPFVAVNCAAIPEAILESELFGYEEGAFTGARRGGKPGKFELAQDGTLFLDEIGDLPLHLQAKLLRAVEDRHVDRLGGRRPIRVNIRVIAATNRDLRHLASLGQFRLDLFYRLAVIPIVIPPLREHREDIPEYASHFVRKYSQALGKSVDGFDQEALRALGEYDWPGNIRELANAVEYAVNLVSDRVIGRGCLPPHVTPGKGDARGVPPRRGRARRDIGREELSQALERFGRSTKAKEAIARTLGISRATLYRRLKECGL